jgi:hypothetical protein
MFNMPESIAELPETRSQENSESVSMLLADLRVPINPTRLARLGKAGGNYPRPLRVQLCDKSERDMLLTKFRASTLPTTEGSKNLVIKQDQTPMQRKKQKLLLDERNTCRDRERAEGDPNFTWVIRRDRVVRVKVKPRPSEREEEESQPDNLGQKVEVPTIGPDDQDVRPKVKPAQMPTKPDDQVVRPKVKPAQVPAKPDDQGVRPKVKPAQTGQEEQLLAQAKPRNQEGEATVQPGSQGAGAQAPPL